MRRGESDPYTKAGLELLSHELTHVIQQTGQPDKKGLLSTGTQVLDQGVTFTRTPNIRIQRLDPPEGGGSEPRRHLESTGALRGVPGGSPEQPVMGARPTTASRSQLPPLSEAQSRILERVIPSTLLYLQIREREQTQEELDRRRAERQYALPPGGLPEEGGVEAQDLAATEAEIQSLEQEIERLDAQIQEGLGVLGLERPDQLVALVTEDFPRLFEERAREIALAELEHNREIVVEEAERYGIQRRYPERSTERIEQDRRGLRSAAQDLVALDRLIEEARGMPSISKGNASQRSNTVCRWSVDSQDCTRYYIFQ